MSPLSRTMALLKSAGWNLVEKTEHWNGFAKRRVDLWGFCDCIAVRGDLVLAVQTTSGSNVSARFHKLRYLPKVAHWLSSDTRKLHIDGWSKRGARGQRKLWTCRTVELRLGPTNNVEMHEGGNAA